MVNLGLPWVCFHEIRINRQTLISIFHSRRAIHQFNVSRAPIWIYFNICGITSQTFRIFLDSPWEITLCEQSISSLPVLFTLYGIQILLILIVLLHLLHLLQSILDILIIKLEQGTFIQINTLIKMSLLEFGVSFPGESFAQLNVIVVATFWFFNGQVTLADAGIEVFKLEIDRCLVCVIGDFVGVRINSLLVEDNSLVKILSFVCLISLAL